MPLILRRANNEIDHFWRAIAVIDNLRKTGKIRTVSKTLLVAFILISLLLSSCGFSTSEITTVTVDTQPGVIELASDFFGGLESADPVSISSYSGYDLVYKYAKQGDRFYYYDNETGLETYYYKDNSGRKYRVEFESAIPDENAYDYYMDLTKSIVTSFVDNRLGFDAAGGAFTFSGSRTDETLGGKSSSSLLINVSGEKNGLMTKIRIEGVKDNEGRVVKLVSFFESDIEQRTDEFRFDYDMKVELPDSFTV